MCAAEVMMSHGTRPDTQEPTVESREPSPKRRARYGRQQLGEILLARGVITQEQLASALELQQKAGKWLGEVLRGLGVSSERIAEALSEQLHVPFFRLRGKADPAILRLLPESVVRRLQAIPVEASDSRITVALVDPLDVLAIDAIRRLTGRDVDFGVTTIDDFNLRLSQLAALDGQLDEPGIEVAAAPDDEAVGADNPLQTAEEAPIVRLVGLILSRAVHERASDIHIEAQEQRLVVRFRIDGMLQTAMTRPRHMHAATVSRIKILARMDISERRLPQDGRINVTIDGKDVDVRVSTVPSVRGEKVVLRLLDKSMGLMSMDRLGLSPALRLQIETIIKRPHGIFLLTGPTGSGKTTTLYAILSLLNAPHRNIMTIEDPVEYRIPGITQVQVNTKTGLTFATGLRSFLRQDPDVIMVGEIRDKETAAIAIQAAMTGHLVLSTLHTNDAPGAVIRLLDMGMEPYLVGSVLVGVGAQRLFRVLCAGCRERTTLDPDVAARLGLPAAASPIDVYRPGECPMCGQTGYHGRAGAFELMPVTETIRSLIVRRASHQELRSAAVEEGMHTLLADGIEKVVSGLTSVEELLRVLELTA
jgi:type IV pilus assembly protein PilB